MNRTLLEEITPCSIVIRVGRYSCLIGWVAVVIAFISGHPVSAQVNPISLNRGANLYDIYCAACHGFDGDGLAQAAEALDPPPRDFTQGMYKFRSTPFGTLPTDKDLQQIISRGIPQTWMPGWSEVLSESQIDDVIAYLKTFLPDDRVWKAGKPIPPAAPMASSDIDLKSGEAFYLLFDCWTCHGFDGRGEGPASKTLIDYKGRKIVPADITHPDYKNGATPGEIRRTLLTGISGTPMPAYEGLYLLARDELEGMDLSTLSEQKQQQVNDFIMSLPARQELDALPETRQIEIARKNEWSLAHYIASLIRTRNLIEWTFGTSP